MITLRLGKMTTQEIANWFGINSTKTLSNSTKKYKHRYEELSEYCEYKKYHGGFEIIKIFDENEIIYIDQRKEVQEYVKNNYKQYWQSLDTCTRVAAELYLNKPKKLKVEYGTIEYYVKKFKNIDYGSTKYRFGEQGFNERVWAKIIGKIGSLVTIEEQASKKYIELTDEEIEFIHKRFNEWYTNIDKAVLEIKEKIANKELDKEKAWEELENTIGLSDASYAGFIETVSREIKCNWVTKASSLHDGVIMGNNDEEFEF